MNREPTPPLRTGEDIYVTYALRTVEAKVALASPNGRALVLRFDAILGGYVGEMAVVWRDDHGAFVDLFCNQTATITRGRMADQA